MEKFQRGKMKRAACSKVPKFNRIERSVLQCPESATVQFLVNQIGGTPVSLVVFIQ